jgi:hypothetical protein
MLLFSRVDAQQAPRRRRPIRTWRGPGKPNNQLLESAQERHEVLLPGRLERGGASRAVKHGELWR